MLRLAILAAATQTAVGFALLAGALAIAAVWGWRASMSDREGGTTSLARRLLVLGGVLAATGLTELAVLPAMVPARAL